MGGLFILSSRLFASSALAEGTSSRRPTSLRLTTAMLCLLSKLIVLYSEAVGDRGCLKTGTEISISRRVHSCRTSQNRGIGGVLCGYEEVRADFIVRGRGE
jgi:hypothetical protein